jgi:hypothetical protein
VVNDAAVVVELEFIRPGAGLRQHRNRQREHRLDESNLAFLDLNVLLSIHPPSGSQRKRSGRGLRRRSIDPFLRFGARELIGKIGNTLEVHATIEGDFLPSGQESLLEFSFHDGPLCLSALCSGSFRGL